MDLPTTSVGDRDPERNRSRFVSAAPDKGRVQRSRVLVDVWSRIRRMHHEWNATLKVWALTINIETHITQRHKPHLATSQVQS